VSATAERTTTTTTLPGRLLHHARERPSATAIREKRLGVWQETTWQGYAERAARTALALEALGVQPGDRVAIQCGNRPEWLLTDLGAQGLGAVVVGIYQTSPAAEVEYLLGHSEAVVLVAEDEEQLDKALEVRDRCPALRHIVVVDPRNVRHLDDPMVTTWAAFEASGEPDVEAYAERAARLQAQDTAMIVYTSGTTGPPKGAMLTHANLAAAAEAFLEVYDSTPDDEVLSYLPLNHVAEQLLSVIDALGAGYVVNFGEGPDTFAADLREVQPTLFLGVPRVWEKVVAGVEIRMSDASRLKRASFRLALRLGRQAARSRMRGRRTAADRLRAGIAWALCLRALRDKLGFGRVQVALSGAAPIAPQVLETLWALGVPVREGYGQTENTALCTYMPADDVRIGTVGRALPGVELRIADDGEILTRSAGVFAGYFKHEDATRDTIDPEGWLHTGDVGVLDDDGFLTITDRKKDIIITAGGKNVSPSEIENLLKVSPWVREAIVIGDRRKFLTALIGIEADTVGDWATRRGLAYTTYGDLARKPEVRELVQGVVDEANARLASVEQVKRFALLQKELDHEDGELTATLKVKRKAIEERFADDIEGLYA
jgi:long-chain acyl-CoA synthetase